MFWQSADVHRKVDCFVLLKDIVVVLASLWTKQTDYYSSALKKPLFFKAGKSFFMDDVDLQVQAKAQMRARGVCSFVQNSQVAVLLDFMKFALASKISVQKFSWYSTHATILEHKTIYCCSKP